jgi:adenosylcobyric acid synthase
MRPLMVLGCTSDAGKSLLVTALCAWFYREGVRVAPFKAQNMSNNARVVATEHGSGEIGVAQWLQARAAGVEPDVRMNPVLLKPEADTQSQVVVRGRADRALTDTPWQERHDALWTPMATAFDELAADFDLVIIEGAGSPAEINLVDQVNNRMIEYADAAALLVSDIDRGGSFAHLFGTWSLVPDATRSRMAGFVLNKFRGDPSLLAPGPERLTDMTGMAHAGTVPMLSHRLPREEGAIEHCDAPIAAPVVAIPRLPFGSNLDEFHVLSHAANVRWITDPRSILDADVVILPGSKHVAADMAWLRERGLSEAIVSAANAGTPIVGVCGGAMMLGDQLDDPDGVEGAASGTRGSIRTLGLLPLRTTMQREKLAAHVVIDFDHGGAGRRTYNGYEIRHGVVDGGDELVVATSPAGAVAWRHRNVTATTVHGLFEHPAFVEATLGVAARDVLEETFVQLADAVEAHLDTNLLRRLTQSP